MCIIIGNVHQLIGHCLIALNPYLQIVIHKKNLPIISRTLGIISQKFKIIKHATISVAKRISAEFKEYWQFLDAYVDLTSEDGLQRLETHLNNLIEEQVNL